MKMEQEGSPHSMGGRAEGEISALHQLDLPHLISHRTVPAELFPVLGYNGLPSVGLGVQQGHAGQRVGARKDAVRGLREGYVKAGKSCGLL